jgi:hypothetical protein
MQFFHDDAFVRNVGEEPKVTTLDATTGEWSVYDVRAPFCVKLPNVRFSTSAAFVRPFAPGLLATCGEDPSGKFVTILVPSARVDRLSDLIALHRADVPLWLDAETEAAFEEIDRASEPAATWTQLAARLFPHSRSMTAEERTEFDAIAQQWQRPLRRPPKKLPPAP